MRESHSPDVYVRERERERERERAESGVQSSGVQSCFAWGLRCGKKTTKEINFHADVILAGQPGFKLAGTGAQEG